MKRILPFVVLLITISCLTEDSADPGKGSTFSRYYNGGFDDQAQAFEETPDNGFIILATTQITKSNATVQRSKIKLIKTDKYGNQIWQTLYPEFSENPTDLSYYKGRGLLVEKNGDEVTGYTIVGDSIDRNTNVSYPCIVRTDANGIVRTTNGSPEIKSIKTMPEFEGQVITRLSNGNYLVLGSHKEDVENLVLEDMVLAEINKDNLNIEWVHSYGAGGATYVTGLLTNINNSNIIYWGGTVNRGDNTDMRFVYTDPNEEGGYDPINSPGSNEEIGGICFSPITQFNLVGTTDINGNKDILYWQVSAAGIPQDTVIIGSMNPKKENAEEGNAICYTPRDGGVLILGTTGVNEEANDYYLIKLDFRGNILWRKVFGSEKADKGISVKQVDDGSYVILGATKLGGLSSIMLRKTDSKGNIE